MASKTKGENTNSQAGFGLDLEDASASDHKKKAKAKAAPKISAKASKSKKKQKKAKGQKRADPSAVIPKVVSNRMIRRVGIFSGMPTLLAFLVIPTSYFVTDRGWIDFPSSVVLLVSVSCLGLGLLGVSYGIISASWDEEINGSAIGISEFKLNLGRIQDRRQSQKEERKRVKDKEKQAKADKEAAKAKAATAAPEAPDSQEEPADS